MFLHHIVLLFLFVSYSSLTLTSTRTELFVLAELFAPRVPNARSLFAHCVESGSNRSLLASISHPRAYLAGCTLNCVCVCVFVFVFVCSAVYPSVCSYAVCFVYACVCAHLVSFSNFIHQVFVLFLRTISMITFFFPSMLQCCTSP